MLDFLPTAPSFLMLSIVSKRFKTVPRRVVNKSVLYRYFTYSFTQKYSKIAVKIHFYVPTISQNTLLTKVFLKREEKRSRKVSYNDT